MIPRRSYPAAPAVLLTLADRRSNDILDRLRFKVERLIDQVECAKPLGYQGGGRAEPVRQFDLFPVPEPESLREEISDEASSLQKACGRTTDEDPEAF